MTSKINIVLLCAGKSSRLKFNLPKVILPINGKTLLQRSLHSLGKLSPSKTIIVAGFKKELVINLSKTLNYKNLNFVVQKEQLGTGDAVKKAASSLDNKSIALIMNGDTPFVDEGTINQALSQYRKTGKMSNIKTEDAAGVGIITKQNATKDVKIGDERKNVKKLGLENFDDGKNPGRKGLSQRVGIPKNATMAQLQKAAKSGGEKGRLARWQINMRRGRKKKK